MILPSNTLFVLLSGVDGDIPDVRFLVHWSVCDSGKRLVGQVEMVIRQNHICMPHNLQSFISMMLWKTCNSVKMLQNCMIPGSSKNNIKQPCTIKCDPCECAQRICCSICMSTCPCNTK